MFLTLKLLKFENEINDITIKIHIKNAISIIPVKLKKYFLNFNFKNLKVNDYIYYSSCIFKVIDIIDNTFILETHNINF